jgi:hypothetical protein
MGVWVHGRARLLRTERWEGGTIVTRWRGQLDGRTSRAMPSVDEALYAVGAPPCPVTPGGWPMAPR